MSQWLKEASIKSFLGAQIDALKQVTSELEDIYSTSDGDKVSPGREHDFTFIQEQLKQITANIRRAAETAKAKVTNTL